MSALRQYTGSFLDLGAACTLAAVADTCDDGTSDEADRGTAVHTFLHAVGDSAPPRLALTLIPPEHHALCMRINLAALDLRSKDEREVAVAYNPWTGEGRRLPGVVRRNYPQDWGGQWIFLTPDVAGFRDGTAFVDDYKTGWTATARWQITAGVLAWAAIHGLTEGRGRLTYVRDDGEVWRAKEDFRFDALDLEAKRIELRDMVAEWNRRRADDDRPKPVPGPHCKFCKSWRNCEEKVGLVRMAAGEHGIARLEQIGHAANDTDDVARAMALAAALKEAAGRIEKQAYAIAAQTGPYLLDETWALGYHPHTEPPELSGPAVFTAVAAQLGAEYARVAVTMEATKASIGRAVDQARADCKIAHGNGAETTRQIMAAVRAAGGVTEHKPTSRLGKYRHHGKELQRIDPPAPEPEQDIEAALRASLARPTAANETQTQEPTDKSQQTW